MRYIFWGLLAFVLCLSLENCANKTAPQGGPKDTLAPYMVEALPKNQGTNFVGKTIIVRFNEWIKDNNLQKELLIVPPIKDYTPKVIRNRVEIRLKSDLLPNTTYSINFRKGIADITESNVAISDTIKKMPLKISFSTGAFLDSLEAAGKARSFFSNTPAKNAIIALYAVDDTLTLRKHAPYFFTQTDENGAFRLSNLKAGKYRVYAFQDADQSFSYQANEEVAFLPAPIALPDTNALKLELSLYKDDHKPAEVLKSRPIGSEYEILWNEKLQNVKASFAKEVVPYCLLADKKTLRFFNPKGLKDSVKVELETLDSLGNVGKTTAFLEFRIPDSRKKTKRAYLEPKLKTHAENGFEEEVALDFEFDQPIEKADLDKIRVLVDKDSVKQVPLCSADGVNFATWNETKNVLTVKRKPFFKERMVVLADSGVFIGVKGDSSKTIKQPFSLKKAEDFASISGNIKTEKKAFIFQLINDKNEVVRTVKNAKSFNFKYLAAGTYRIRVLIDENQNGVWDSGDLDKNTPPEPMLFFELQNEGKLRDKWDLQGHTISF